MMIHIPLETPSKKNSRVVDRRTGRTFPNKRYTEWHKAAALYVRQQNAHPLDGGPFALYLLVDCGVLPDDNWMVVSKIVTTNLYDKGNPGVNISIVPLTDSEKLSRL